MASSPAQVFVRENAFYRKLGIGLALFAGTIFLAAGIAGFTDIRAMPGATHVHAAVMTAWLALFAVQNWLGAGANIALHRRLGWLGAGLAVLVVVSGVYAQFATIGAGRVPVLFGNGYFLALGLVNLALFSAFFISAIRMRKRTDWHRRLMLGSLIIIFEPVLGRVLLIATVLAAGEVPGPEFEPPPRLAVEGMRMGLHLLIVLPIMLRDRAIRGKVHPALWWVLASLFASYGMINLLGEFPPVDAFADSLVR
ncbi:hypothetical protein [Aurantiacibacter marinus]|uniref:hypothetical protein n=1 Tax=Aurantiacibacter marinus TaxID=874156 RepID=UPI0006996564|nr:hypothetical protein [Aurantiacibacter marinus]